MDQKAASESLFLSGCAFFILLMLCSISHAGSFGHAGGDYSAPVRLESVPSAPVVQNSEPETKETLKPPLPQKPEQAKPLISTETLNNPAATFEDFWLDRPGNGYKLGAYVLGTASLVPLIIGSYFLGILYNREPVNCYDLGCMYTGIGTAITGYTSLGVGIASALTAIALFITGEVKSRKADQYKVRQVEISPYINPLAKKDLTASAGISVDGAVAGVRGTF